MTPSSNLRPRREPEVGHVDALQEPRVVERDLDAERPEALDALQLPELEALDRAGQIGSDNPATLAIRDKANLLLGDKLLAEENADGAKQVLDRVRLNGAF